MIAIVSRSSAAHRARSCLKAAAKASAHSRLARVQATAAASRACFLRLYHVDLETPAANHGLCAGRLGPMPCALRQRSDRKRAFSRRSASVIVWPIFARCGHRIPARHSCASGSPCRCCERFAARIFSRAKSPAPFLPARPVWPFAKKSSPSSGMSLVSIWSSGIAASASMLGSLSYRFIASQLALCECIP